MCGIAGIAVFGDGKPPKQQRLEAMCQVISHRGPDDQGMDIRGNVAMGMRRLAIIDLSGGKQPIFNEDRTIWIVFNGEIYNFKELRRDLIKKGHLFKTASDTEVIVHAYEEYGSNFPDCLNGMFAFAIHDIRENRLLLVRDHVGIKPLYYQFTDTELIWGSEIKSILAAGNDHQQLNMQALAEFLAWEYVPGNRTLFSSIFQLEPGQVLEVDLNHPVCRPRTYWDVPEPESKQMSQSEWMNAVDAKIRECVQRQLVSDVPLGAFLSGGVDSSLVVSAMGPARTFSIGFDDPSYNELTWARQVANHLQVDHIDDIIQPDIVALFDQLMYHMDNPIGDFSIFPTYLVSRHARQYVTVALSGDGGDELFGGYETYVADHLAAVYGCLPRIFRKGLIEPLVRSFRPRPEKKGLINKALRFVEGLAHDDGLAHARWRLFMGQQAMGQLLTPEAADQITEPLGRHILALFDRAGGRDPVNRNLYVDFKSYLCDNCLVKVDRMSMAVSLEVRVPLLDKELVSLAFSIPDHLKLVRGQTKVLLKKVATRHVPESCVYRPKQGFSIPIKNWLGAELKPIMDELLHPQSLKAQGIFRVRQVERLRQQHLDGLANHSHILWAIMVFQAWYGKWFCGG